MELDVQINDRLAKINLLNKNENNYTLSLDGKEYKVDIIMVERGVYSLLIGGKSYNIELIEGDNGKKYIVKLLMQKHDI